MDISEFFNEVNKKIAAEFVSESLDIGIYPRSVEGGEHSYKERTDYMNGWNAASIKIGENIENALEQFRKCDEDLAILVLAGVGFFVKDRFLLNINDTFYYACADCEEVKPEEYNRVASLFKRYGYGGIDYWVSAKRNEKSEIPRVQAEIERIAALEEARKK